MPHLDSNISVPFERRMLTYEKMSGGQIGGDHGAILDVT